jgi:hypothetical protein
MKSTNLMSIYITKSGDHFRFSCEREGVFCVDNNIHEIERLNFWSKEFLEEKTTMENIILILEFRSDSNINLLLFIFVVVISCIIYYFYT